MRKVGLVLLAVLCAAAVGAVADDAVVGSTDPIVKDGTRVMPEYPPAALAAGLQGVVSVAAVVNADGSLGAVEVIDNSAPGLGFDKAALSAIRQWKFDPARLDGAAVDSVGAFVFRFESSGRFNPDTYVGARFLGSKVVGDPIGKTDGSLGHNDGGGYSPAAMVKDRFFTPRKGPARYGALYDRTTLLPPQHRAAGHAGN